MYRNLAERNRVVARFWGRLQHSENTALLLLAVGVGLATGVGVWLFRKGIEFFHLIFTEQLAQITLAPILGAAAIVATLALAGLIVGWMVQHLIGEERHHGVAGIMESVALAGGRLRYARMPIKAFASALSLGAGASLGPEDPSVQIGANLGSFFGQKLHLSDDHVRMLVAAGGGAAIAAVFRAPIAGVFFAMEVILNGEFGTSSFGVVVLACVVSSVVTQAIEIGGPEFGALTYTLGSLLEMPLYVLLGLLLAPICVLFIRSIYWQHDLWHNYTHRLSRPLRTALAGALVAVVGIFLPQILSTGSDTMMLVLNAPDFKYTLGLLVLLGLVKIILTGISMAGGFVGGIFAPSLFVGVMLGGAFGRVIDSIFPVGAVSDSRAYAIAGMAAVMAGVVRAPITAIMLVFEVTNDYRLILPIMLSSVVCVFVAELIQPDGIYAFGLAQKGIRLPRGRDLDLMQSVTVGEAMVTPAPSIREDASLVELRDMLRETGLRSLCVLNDAGELVGIVTYKDLQNAYGKGDEARIVGNICTREVITATPDQTLAAAIRNMAARDLGRLPVLQPGTRVPIGMLSRIDLVRAYNAAVSRKIESQHAVEQVRLQTLTGAHVVELLVKPGAPVIGKRLRDIPFPAESIVAAIRRGEHLIVPHGNTEIRLWDTLTVVTEPDYEAELAQLTGRESAQAR